MGGGVPEVAERHTEKLSLYNGDREELGPSDGCVEQRSVRRGSKTFSLVCAEQHLALVVRSNFPMRKCTRLLRVPVLERNPVLGRTVTPSEDWKCAKSGAIAYTEKAMCVQPNGEAERRHVSTP